MKQKLFLALILLSVVMWFGVQNVFIQLDPYQVIQIETLSGKKEYLENQKADPKVVWKFHKEKLVCSARRFSMVGVPVYAENMSKYLRNNFEFTVHFPFSQINPADTMIQFCRIKANAILAIQKATNIIESDFYGRLESQEDSAYPELLEHFMLDAQRSVYGDGLHVTDVTISQINYVSASLDAVRFITESNLLLRRSTMDLNHGRYSSLNDFCERFIEQTRL